MLSNYFLNLLLGRLVHCMHIDIVDKSRLLQVLRQQQLERSLRFVRVQRQQLEHFSQLVQDGRFGQLAHLPPEPKIAMELL